MLSASPCPSNVAFPGAGEPLWNLAVAAGGAVADGGDVAALECILGVGCEVLNKVSRKHERVAVGHQPSDATEMWRDASAWGPKAAASLQLCWSVSGVKKEGEWWHGVGLKARDRKALNVTV